MFGEQAKGSGHYSSVSCCGTASRVPSGKSFSYSLCLDSPSAEWCTTLPLRGFIRKNIPNRVCCAASIAMRSPGTTIRPPLGPLGVLLLLMVAGVHSHSAQRRGSH